MSKSCSPGVFQYGSIQYFRSYIDSVDNHKINHLSTLVFVCNNLAFHSEHLNTVYILYSLECIMFHMATNLFFFLLQRGKVRNVLPMLLAFLLICAFS